MISLALGILSFALVRNNPGDVGLPSMRELDGHSAQSPYRGHWFEGLRQVPRNRDNYPDTGGNLCELETEYTTI